MNKTVECLKERMTFVKNFIGDNYHEDTCYIAIQEIERLLRGDFTEEEFQNLCHNFSEDDAQRFCNGCIEYNKKMFGEKSCLK